MRKHSIFLCFALCLCMAQNIWSLLPREYDAFPKEYDCPYTEEPAKRSFYLGAFGGTWSSVIGEQPSHLETPFFRDIPGQFYLGGAIGFRFVAPWRIEAEVTYRHSRSSWQNIDAWSGMANILRDFRLFALRPYLGLGAGYFRAGKIFHKISMQVLVGIAYPIQDRFNVGIEYRYFQPLAWSPGMHNVGLTARSLF